MVTSLEKTGPRFLFGPAACGAAKRVREKIFAPAVCVLLLLISGVVRADQEASRPAMTASRPAAATQPAEDRLGPAPPQIGQLDRVDLCRLARRAMVDVARHESPAEPLFTPSSLEGIKCRASVTLRLKGRLLGTADSEPLPVVDAVVQAAQAAFKAGSIKILAADAELGDLGIEIELCGPGRQVGNGGDDAARLAGQFHPAIHGVSAQVDGKEVLIRPSQLISMETFCERDDELDHRCDKYEIAIRNLQEKLGVLSVPPTRPPESVSIWRFRTTHWYQPAARSEPVALVAGLRPVPPGEVTLDSMRATCADLAKYLMHRQNSDGLFSYEFLPGRDLYWFKDNNWVRQAGTAWVMAVYARKSNDPSAAESAERALTGLAVLVRPTIGNPRGAYLHTPDSLHAVGAAALYALALMDAPTTDRHADLLASLMAGMETMQMEDGRIRGHFPPSQLEASEDYYPGEALLAIARYYARHPDEQRRAICDKALPYYMRYFRATHSTACIPWQVQAWGQMARTTRLRKYADFVFEMADYLVAMQLDERTLPLAVYDGGLDTGERGRSAANTGVGLEGIVDAIHTADTFGEVERAAHYREIARRAARFVVQLRFREEECYYVQSPKEAVGGVRNSPINPTLRIDHTQHALAGLLGTLDVLEKRER